MTLTVTEDRGEIDAQAERFLLRDGVRGTTLGTIRDTLAAGAWAAWSADRLAVRSGTDLPLLLVGGWTPAATGELARLLDAIVPAALTGPAPVVRALHERLGRPAAAPPVRECLYRCDTLVEPTGVDGEVEVVTAAHRALLVEWVRAFQTEAGARFGTPEAFADRAVAGGGRLWRSAAGELVALAYRRPVHAGSARVGPVYTTPAARGHGYGSAVTAAATRDVLADGAVPVLFTDLANPTSNRIYRQLGYRPVEERLLVTLA